MTAAGGMLLKDQTWRTCPLECLLRAPTLATVNVVASSDRFRPFPGLFSLAKCCQALPARIHADAPPEQGPKCSMTVPWTRSLFIPIQLNFPFQVDLPRIRPAHRSPADHSFSVCRRQRYPARQPTRPLPPAVFSILCSLGVHMFK